MAFFSGFAQDLVESLITLFVILNPIGAIPVFQGLASNQKRMIARKAVLVTFVVLLVFAYMMITAKVMDMLMVAIGISFLIRGAVAILALGTL